MKEMGSKCYTTFSSYLMISSLFNGIVQASVINRSASTSFGIERNIPSIPSKSLFSNSFSIDCKDCVVLCMVY